MTSQLGICLLIFVAVIAVAPGLCLDAFFLPKSAWIAFAGGILLLVWLYQLRRRVQGPPRLGIEWPLAAAVITSLLSIFATGDPLPLLFPFSLFLFHAGLVYLFAKKWKAAGHRPDPHPLDWALAGGIVAAIYVLLQSYGLDPFTWQGGVSDWRGRFTGTMGGPNFVAGYLAVILPWGIYRYYSTSGAKRALPFLCLIPILACLVVTFSVGAWSGIVAAGLFAVVVRLRSCGTKAMSRSEPRARKYFIRSVILLILILCISGFYLSDNPWNGVGGSLVKEAKGSSRWLTGHAARRFIWKTTALMVRDRPVLGIGFANYFRVHQIYQGELYLRRGLPHDRPFVSNVPQVHNEYYQHLAETGVVGFLALAWLIVAGVKVIRVNWRRTPDRLRPAFLAVMCGLVVGGVHALTSFPLRVPPTALLLSLLAGFVLYPRPRAATSSSRTATIRWRIGSAAAAFLILVAMYAGIAPAVASGFLNAAAPSKSDSLSLTAWAARVHPFSHTTHDYLARILAGRGRFEDALAESEKALRYRDAFLTRKLRRDIYTVLEDWDHAAEEGSRMLELNPMYPPLVVEQAQLARKAAHPVDALLDRAERLIPGLLAEGKRDQAGALGDQIVELDPSRRKTVQRLLAGAGPPGS